ncbi:Phage protein [Pseudomonas chlororaphis subsp. aurantiaca]|uniref:hypothetical protein n=1 Tax=Pseudomonas chlororaphis TaxID=587753 RepID=UPI000F563E2F|nr:hypothetical protein [Pseudomonas chlororaphis]AZD34631.1 Phage protein [Pseudomonas chlororaphis subsp. aurantiaca]AZD40966.1 Phage protein [Pseudomonas chlororaphis subsp. aurantiaca]
MIIKERPILFSAPMVRPILAGQKTVTRREVKDLEPGCRYRGIDPDGLYLFTAAHSKGLIYDHMHCPHGRPGDRLWVRESLGYDCEYGHYFAAGGVHGETVYLCSLFDDEETQTGPSYDGLLPERSVPSIHLHRRYSRILLEVTAVRVERLQDISEDQALAEGIAKHPDGGYHVKESGHYWAGPIDSFASLWESINGAGAWDVNPWVWVVEFKQVTP